MIKHIGAVQQYGQQQTKLLPKYIPAWSKPRLYISTRYLKANALTPNIIRASATPPSETKINVGFFAWK